MPHDFGGAHRPRFRSGSSIVGSGRNLRWAIAEPGGGGWRGWASTVRDWVLAFNADGPVGSVTGTVPGREPILKDHQRSALRAIVEAGPMPAVHGVVRWRIVDLRQWLWDTFQVTPSKLNRPRIAGDQSG